MCALLLDDTLSMVSPGESEGKLSKLLAAVFTASQSEVVVESITNCDSCLGWATCSFSGIKHSGPMCAPRLNICTVLVRDTEATRISEGTE